MESLEETCSLATFHENSAEIIQQLKGTHRSVTLTVDGKPEVILQDVTEYQRLRDLAAAADIHEGIRQGLEESAAGKGRPASEFLDYMREKYGLSR
ncbi:type II toxin-antitoxin system Phd/YefM family antitoxin [Granulicella tundricola]|uniref:Prevent-host-death family protein n=1 Tax=Granulicella tundricola (strain ATCC BAA-1859 / DSM 23138 / MP5ACTX9) TaxID=1198114 RepID=E8X492_GRATM|nr:type II toxin-antitoxin system Phd/YefM family antitoxin [Granulicella tundricola]ADW67152.1 prevent-host-death family protein [Granulicella tundricola MP5ACTX9]